MSGMTYERTKVASWELFTDGEWHNVRTGPPGELMQESMRQYRRHWESLRAWAPRNGYRGQLSRREGGRILQVRMLPKDAPGDAGGRLRGMSRQDLGIGMMTAVRLVEYAIHLRLYGERAPGGSETWQEFDRRAEKFLRSLSKMP